MSVTPLRLAATVVIMRDSAGGLEVLLTKRPGHLRFMGGASVFPGGALDPADLDPAWEEMSPVSGEQAAAALGIEDPRTALGLYVCALREAFEEVGLPVGPATGPLIRGEADDARLFLEACRRSGARLATDDLVPAGRWVTPEGSPVRFDARFFLVRAPAGWEPVADPKEVDGCAWVSSASALAGLASESLLMAPPTIQVFQRLEGLADADGAVRSLSEAGLAGAGEVLSVRLSPLVHVVLAPNPGIMTGPGTNTYIVGSGPTVVIDPAVENAPYMAEVVKVAGQVSSILVTHRHPDHIGGVKMLASLTGAPVRAWGTGPIHGLTPSPIDDRELIETGGAALRALYTPGHASDHLSFCLETTNSLFAGDNIVGEGTAVIAPPDGNLREYLSSLRIMEELQPERIYPGHFRPLQDGPAVIRSYIEHRAERDAQILGAIAAEPLSLEQIVERVYRDSPAALRPVAAFSVQAHLEMAEQDGRAMRIDHRWTSSLQD
jgi:glyoxylase-like metal-dependent hydrolase (beta-lactamase superfamily II)/8-oxo-dGTP pyrophosphatase MutT (NUDIX family)